eukprot:SAG31_NODE_1020_length_10349_cov_5.621561_10_plen_75_part_00
MRTYVPCSCAEKQESGLATVPAVATDPSTRLLPLEDFPPYAPPDGAQLLEAKPTYTSTSAAVSSQIRYDFAQAA